MNFLYPVAHPHESFNIASDFASGWVKPAVDFVAQKAMEHPLVTLAVVGAGSYLLYRHNHHKNLKINHLTSKGRKSDAHLTELSAKVATLESEVKKHHRRSADREVSEQSADGHSPRHALKA